MESLPVKDRRSTTVPHNKHCNEETNRGDLQHLARYHLDEVTTTVQQVHYRYSISLVYDNEK